VSLLEEALELLRSADGSWQTMRAEGTAWEDRMAGRALRTRPAVAGRSRRAIRRIPNAARLDLSGAVPLGEREQYWRLWRGGQLLLRAEYEIAQETVTVVAQGPRWWRWSSSLGSTSGGAASRPVRVVLGPAAVLLSGAELVEQLVLVDAGRARVAGRDAYLLRGRPLPLRGQARTVLREAGAEEYELRVDAERGALLGVSAIAEGRPFRVVQATLVGFDETFSPSQFSPRSSQQARFVTQAPRQVTVAELPGSLSFPVLVPSPSPSPVPPHVAVLPADRTGSLRAVLTWAVAGNGKRGQLRLQLTADEPAPAARDHWTAGGDVIWSQEEHRGIVRYRVRTLRHGTFAELESSVLDLDHLTAIARSLAPLDAGEPGG
jgi:hypothetical protein